jgi:hypothetical protein
LQTKQIVGGTYVGRYENILHCEATKYPSAWFVSFPQLPHFTGARIEYLDIHMPIAITPDRDMTPLGEPVYPSAKLTCIFYIDVLGGVRVQLFENIGRRKHKPFPMSA